MYIHINIFRYRHESFCYYMWVTGLWVISLDYSLLCPHLKWLMKERVMKERVMNDAIFYIIILSKALHFVFILLKNRHTAFYFWKGCKTSWQTNTLVLITWGVGNNTDTLLKIYLWENCGNNENFILSKIPKRKSPS